MSEKDRSTTVEMLAVVAKTISLIVIFALSVEFLLWYVL